MVKHSDHEGQSTNRSYCREGERERGRVRERGRNAHTACKLQGGIE